MIAGKLCPTCEGYGKRPMNAEERKARNRQTARARRLNMPTPSLPPIECEPCGGRGWLPENVTPMTKGTP